MLYAVQCQATIRDYYYTIPPSIFSAQSNFLELFISLVEQISSHLCILTAAAALPMWPPKHSVMLITDLQPPVTTGNSGAKGRGFL